MHTHLIHRCEVTNKLGYYPYRGTVSLARGEYNGSFFAFSDLAQGTKG